MKLIDILDKGGEGVVEVVIYYNIQGLKKINNIRKTLGSTPKMALLGVLQK